MQAVQIDLLEIIPTLTVRTSFTVVVAIVAIGGWFAFLLLVLLDVVDELSGLQRKIGQF